MAIRKRIPAIRALVLDRGPCRRQEGDLELQSLDRPLSRRRRHEDRLRLSFGLQHDRLGDAQRPHAGGGRAWRKIGGQPGRDRGTACSTRVLPRRRPARPPSPPCRPMATPLSANDMHDEICKKKTKAEQSEAPPAVAAKDVPEIALSAKARPRADAGRRRPWRRHRADAEGDARRGRPGIRRCAAAELAARPAGTGRRHRGRLGNAVQGDQPVKAAKN